MPPYKKLGANKIRPKKPNPGGKLLSLGKGLSMGAFNSIKKGLSTVEITPYSQISLSISGLMNKLSMPQKQFRTLLEDELFSRRKDGSRDPDLESIMAYATATGIIENRLDECFKFSIASNPLMIEKFFSHNNLTQNRISHIQNIINNMLANFSKAEVDRRSLDSDEKNLLKSIVYQFRDPSSAQMGIPKSDIDGRFDFFKEWCSNVFTSINPDIPLRSGSKKTKKKLRKKHPCDCECKKCCKKKKSKKSKKKNKKKKCTKKKCTKKKSKKRKGSK